ncbi:winged helix-turn-helix transcriptional regulator [Candidatus Bipolaricaulota bacterium]|jgi:ArsR family transcriptional regulator|nr:winged helix-turn-helix transcriptional regulator [Candidatus Bipolaricaulota bacterium]TFH10674.1 MAG: ArsR family transcriptional regulator [Candidatus Atribacteria bacterium]
MAHEASEIFKALSVPSRIHILSLLKAHGPMPVKDIAEAVGMTSPAISQHLKILKSAGLVDAQRQGYWVPYAVNVEALHNCCGHLIQVCACPSCHDSDDVQHEETQTEQLLHKREMLLAELQRIENELETLR